MKQLKLSVCMLTFFVVFETGRVSAQVVTANLQGVVTDASGASVAGANVTA